MSRRKRKPQKRKPQRSKKKIIIGSLAAIMVGFAIVIYGLTASYLTKNYLTEKVEKSFNCRFEIGDIDLSLWSPTATIALSEVKFAPRDSYANDRTPHDDRTPLESSKVSVEKLEIKVSMIDILFRNLNVESLRLEEFKAELTLYDNGRNDIEPLFAKPKDSEKDERDEGITFNVLSSSDLVAHLREFSLVDAELEVNIQASDLKVMVSQLNVDMLEEFELNVKDLASMAPAKFGFRSRVDLHSGDQSTHYGMVEFDGAIEGSVFSPENGDLDPNLELKLKIGDRSHLKKIPVIQKVADAFLGIRSIPFLQDGDRKAWPETYLFEGDKVFHSKFHKNTYTIESALAVDAGSWTLALQPGSYFSTNDSQHQFDYKLYASTELSKKVDSLVATRIKSLPGKLGTIAGKEIQRLVDADGRFALDFRTTGSLSSPNVELVSKLPNLGNIKEGIFDIFR